VDVDARELAPTVVPSFTLVQIIDEITIDLVGSARGIIYNTARREVDRVNLYGVRVSLASPAIIRESKLTDFEDNAFDRSFNRKWFTDHGQEPARIFGEEVASST
jgi:hypothetical protein